MGGPQVDLGKEKVFTFQVRLSFRTAKVVQCILKRRVVSTEDSNALLHSNAEKIQLSFHCAPRAKILGAAKAGTLMIIISANYPHSGERSRRRPHNSRYA